MTYSDITIGDVLNWILPPVSIALWCAIYVIYFWRQREVRDWVERHLHHHRSRPRGRKSRRTPPAAPVIFCPAPTRPAPRPPRTAMITTATAAVTARLAEWRVDNLPLRYRLLGQVRRPDNDN